MDDAILQEFAQNGNRPEALVDMLSEARNVLADHLTVARFPSAGDVKIQVEYSPPNERRVPPDRLRDPRAPARVPGNYGIDTGEIGTVHSVTAICEITPIGSLAVLNTLAGRVLG